MTRPLAVTALVLVAAHAAAQEPPPELPTPSPERPPAGAYRVVYGPLPNEPPAAQVSTKLWVGPSYARFLDLAVYGAAVGADVGRQFEQASFYGEIEGVFGRTDHGLTSFAGWLAGTGEGHIDRVRLGGGVRFGFLAFKRATTGGIMAGLGVGPFAFATVDVFRYEEKHAVYVGVRFDATWIDAGGWPASPWLLAPAATVGWRY